MDICLLNKIFIFHPRNSFFFAWLLFLDYFCSTTYNAFSHRSPTHLGSTMRAAQQLLSNVQCTLAFAISLRAMGGLQIYLLGSRYELWMARIALNSNH